jgi:hypothetical protein
MKIMTPVEARTLLENIKKEAPEKRQAAVNTIVEAAISWSLASIKRDDWLRERVEFLLKRAGAKVAPQAQQAQAVAGEQDAEQPEQNMAAAEINTPAGPVVMTEDGEIHGLDGLSDEDRKAAVEAAMDAAMSGTEPNAAAPAPTPLSQPKPRNGRPKPAATT